jgi:hypothetical protein
MRLYCACVTAGCPSWIRCDINRSGESESDNGQRRARPIRLPRFDHSIPYRALTGPAPAHVATGCRAYRAANAGHSSHMERAPDDSTTARRSITATLYIGVRNRSAHSWAAGRPLNPDRTGRGGKPKPGHTALLLLPRNSAGSFARRRGEDCLCSTFDGKRTRRAPIPGLRLVFEGSDHHIKTVHNGADATFLAGLPGPSQKIQKSSKSLLTLWRGPDYIRLTNDGGDAAGDEEVRF